MNWAAVLEDAAFYCSLSLDKKDAFCVCIILVKLTL